MKVAVGVFVLVEGCVAVLVGVGETGGVSVRVGEEISGRCVGTGAGAVAEGGARVGMAACRVLVGCNGLRVAAGRTVSAVAVGEAVGEVVGVALGVRVGVFGIPVLDQYAPMTTI